MGRTGRRAAKLVPRGECISSTMMVMMTARTPSLKASRRPLFMRHTSTGSGDRARRQLYEYLRGQSPFCGALKRRAEALLHPRADIRRASRVEAPQGCVGAG